MTEEEEKEQRQLYGLKSVQEIIKAWQEKDATRLSFLPELLENRFGLKDSIEIIDIFACSGMLLSFWLITKDQQAFQVQWSTHYGRFWIVDRIETPRILLVNKLNPRFST